MSWSTSSPRERGTTMRRLSSMPRVASFCPLSRAGTWQPSRQHFKAYPGMSVLSSVILHRRWRRPSTMSSRRQNMCWTGSTSSSSSRTPFADGVVFERGKTPSQRSRDRSFARASPGNADWGRPGGRPFLYAGRSIHSEPLSRAPAYPVCAEGDVRDTVATAAHRLVGPLSVPSVRAPGEDRESNPGPGASDAPDNRVKAVEREDGRDEQQDQAHQTPWLWLSKPRAILFKIAPRDRSSK